MRHNLHLKTVALTGAASLFALHAAQAQETNLSQFLHGQLEVGATHAAYCAENMPAQKDQILSTFDSYKLNYAKASEIVIVRFQGSKYLTLVPVAMDADASAALNRKWALDTAQRLEPKAFCTYFLSSITDKTPEHIAKMLGDSFAEVSATLAGLKSK